MYPCRHIVMYKVAPSLPMKMLLHYFCLATLIGPLDLHPAPTFPQQAFRCNFVFCCGCCVELLLPFVVGLTEVVSNQSTGTCN
ncbi:hypothetical protein XELAEV_18008867mg [Xenopus laevis]|uniref:Uncharacterized protein n=1 Tax=Xenopus laevis TaxID=8355 RepID=A0A974DTQ9_XENLA|nr:hypothetical protein XELAEV_18008867mg [Xenopus laevis]